MAETEAVDTAQRRLAQSGLAAIEERGTTCCYATQDKFWVQDASNSERWEIYTVLADSPTFSAGDIGCCGSSDAVDKEQLAAACC